MKRYLASEAEPSVGPRLCVSSHLALAEISDKWLALSRDVPSF